MTRPDVVCVFTKVDASVTDGASAIGSMLIVSVAVKRSKPSGSVLGSASTVMSMCAEPNVLASGVIVSVREAPVPVIERFATLFGMMDGSCDETVRLVMVVSVPDVEGHDVADGVLGDGDLLGDPHRRARLERAHVHGLDRVRIARVEDARESPLIRRQAGVGGGRVVAGVEHRAALLGLVGVERAAVVFQTKPSSGSAGSASVPIRFPLTPLVMPVTPGSTVKPISTPIRLWWLAGSSTLVIEDEHVVVVDGKAVEVVGDDRVLERDRVAADLPDPSALAKSVCVRIRNVVDDRDVDEQRGGRRRS